MNEIDVIQHTRSFLQRQGLLNRRVTDLYTDAHPALLGVAQLEPFQRFHVPFDTFTTHPDLVGRLDDGETTFAVEAKGANDWIKGIAQADTYRQGFHAALLAVPGTPSADLVGFARQRGLGIIAVRPQQTVVLETPPVHLPRLTLAASIQRQFSAGATLTTQFGYNFPTHYLACAVCLSRWEQQFSTTPAPIEQFIPFVRQLYPTLPRDSRPALRGAAKLGLLQISGKAVELTRLGRTCSALLPPPDDLAHLHQQALKQPLTDLAPQTGAVLRILLDREPIAAFLTQVLGRIGFAQPTPMPVLVEQASRLDKALTPTVFFFPHVVADLVDDQGFIVWRKVAAQHYRTSIYMQYKRILTHAGVIRDHGLSGTSSQHYQPERDLWELIR